MNGQTDFHQKDKHVAMLKEAVQEYTRIRDDTLSKVRGAVVGRICINPRAPAFETARRSK